MRVLEEDDDRHLALRHPDGVVTGKRMTILCALPWGKVNKPGGRVIVTSTCQYLEHITDNLNEGVTCTHLLSAVVASVATGTLAAVTITGAKTRGSIKTGGAAAEVFSLLTPCPSPSVTLSE